MSLPLNQPNLAVAIKAFSDDFLNSLQPFHPEFIRPALKVSSGEDVSREIINKRTANSKTFQLGPDKYKLIMNRSIIHYEHHGQMEEIDLLIKEADGKKVMRKAPYKIEIFTDRIGYFLQKPDGTDYTIELVKIEDSPVDNSKLETVTNDCQMFWQGMAKDISIKIMLLPGKPELFTQISSPTAPKSFTWKVIHQGQFNFKSMGGDNDQNSLEIKVDQQKIDDKSFFYTETWTGRVSRKDKKTRIKSWHNDPVYPVVVLDPTYPVYPVVIDPTTTLNITRNNDDGFQKKGKQWIASTSILTNNWNSNSVKVGHGLTITGEFKTSSKNYYGAFRFRNVKVPKGASIISATMKVYSSATLTHNFNIYGNKAANTVTPFSKSNGPLQFIKTAGKSWIPAIGWNSISVKNQVASIVGLGGWTSKNALALGIWPPLAGITDLTISDLNQESGRTAQLIIVYSTGNPRHGDMNFM